MPDCDDVPVTVTLMVVEVTRERSACSADSRDRGVRCERTMAVLFTFVSVTTGVVVSMTMFLFAPREFAAPGDARVSVALFVAASRIVPPFSASEVGCRVAQMARRVPRRAPCS